MKCPTCNGSGEYREEHEAWAGETLGCPDCEGTGSIPDPCPACGFFGHAMAVENGPGPLCARAGFRDVSGDFEGATFYDCQDSEQLQHTAPGDAIEAALDLMDADPETLEVTAYKRAVVDVHDLAERVLEDALERLDEMLGDPGGDPCEPTPSMREAARTFAAAIAADYTPWQCEPCGRATVDIAAWRKAEGPGPLCPGQERLR